jgi:hypothetical protein
MCGLAHEPDKSARDPGEAMKQATAPAEVDWGGISGLDAATP